MNKHPSTMKPSLGPRRTAKPLPPYGCNIVEMLRSRVRPALFGGSIIVALDWSLGKPWPRIVLPREEDPHGYYLDFLAGLDLVIVHRPSHPAHHLAAAKDAIQAARPRAYTVVALPRS